MPPRWLPASLLAVALSGCAPSAAAGALPSLVIRGGVVHRRDHRRDTTRRRWDWQVSADLRWQLAPPGVTPPAPAAPKPTSQGGSTGAAPCLDRSLCAWERRARLRALSALGAAASGSDRALETRPDDPDETRKE